MWTRWLKHRAQNGPVTAHVEAGAGGSEEECAVVEADGATLELAAYVGEYCEALLGAATPRRIAFFHFPTFNLEVRAFDEAFAVRFDYAGFRVIKVDRSQ